MVKATFNLRPAVCLWLACSSCTRSKQENPSTPETDKAVAVVHVASGTLNGAGTGAFTTVIPTGCSAAGVTQTKLITPSVKNGDPNGYLDFQVAVTDCSGIFQTLRPGKLSFDMDGAYEVAKLRYTLTFADNSSSTGVFQVIEGLDRFGNKGPDFASSQSTTNYYPPAATLTVKVRIYLGGYIADETPIPTYLRLGNAAPVNTLVDFQD